jgi:hypothetical protein
MSADDEIPRRIIQTARSRELPLLNRASAASLRSLNPGFEYLFFDDDQVTAFVDEHFRQYRKVFDSFPFRIQRYDFFRYLVVYHCGGFYFDLDVFLASGLSSLLERGCVFPFENLNASRFLRATYEMDWAIGNYAFGAAPGHPFLKAVIENCVRAQQDSRWIGQMMPGTPRLRRDDYYVLNSTGPLLLSRTLAENPQLVRQVTVLFPDDVCDSRNWHQFGDLGFHLMEGSWRKQTGFWKKRFALYVESWTERKFFAESRKLGKLRAVAPLLPSR